MACCARLLLALGALLLAAGQTPVQPAAVAAKPEPAAEAPVEEGTLKEFLHDKAVEAEEVVSEVVEDASTAVEDIEEDVYEAVTGASGDGTGEEFDFDSTHAGRRYYDSPESHDVHLTDGHPMIEYTGFIDKLPGRTVLNTDLHKGVLTLSEAKKWCAEHKECQGFYHRGEAGEGPFLVIFKDYWELNVDSQEPFTAYKKEGKLQEGDDENIEMPDISADQDITDEGEDADSARSYANGAGNSDGAANASGVGTHAGLRGHSHFGHHGISTSTGKEL